MEMEDYGAILADTLGGGKPSNSPRVKYGTVTKASGSTLDVSLAGGTITGVCMTVSCAGAEVGDRVVLLVDGALVTCLGIVATADNARYVTSGSSETSALKAYPVGSIYMSVNSTNPKDLLGGTWKQLQNRFLVGVGSSYGNGETGGASSYTPKGSVGGHTLTISEIPSHKHATSYDFVGWYPDGSPNWGNQRLQAYWNGCVNGNSSPDSYGACKLVGDTYSTGGGGSHNHGFAGTAQTILPPYLAVYMWKRTS
jgi:hypothetical protein